MKTHLEHDKTTDVAFIDIDETSKNARIIVIDVTDCLHLKSQVLARVDSETNVLLGLIIEDYSAFRREIRRKFVALAVDRIIDLIFDTVQGLVSTRKSLPSSKLALC